MKLPSIALSAVVFIAAVAALAYFDKNILVHNKSFAVTFKDCTVSVNKLAQVKLGDRVTLNVRSDQAGSFDIHGPAEVSREIEAGKIERITFDPKEAGYYPLELHIGDEKECSGQELVVLNNDGSLPQKTVEEDHDNERGQEQQD